MSTEALLAAAKAGDLAQVQAQIAAGVDVKYREPPGYYDALKFAIVGGHLEVCKLLLDAGADVKLINRMGENAVALALRYRKPVAVGGGDARKDPPAHIEEICTILKERDPEAYELALEYVAKEQRKVAAVAALGCCEVM